MRRPMFAEQWLTRQGVPVVGANVVAVGTAAGTATDFDGNFCDACRCGAAI